MSYEMNQVLFDLADWRLTGDQEKQAFVPGGPGSPMDPAAAGGMPPMPPMDPMAGGGAPPMDPAAMGAAPPMDPMAMAGAAPAAAPAPAAGAPGAPGAAGGKPKIDPTFIYMELSRVRKLLTHMMQSTGIDMPPDILDDGAVAMVAQGQMPQSSPLGASGTEGQPPADPAAAAGGAALPGMGGDAAIAPIEPAGAEKAGSDVMSIFRGPAGRAVDPAETHRLRIEAVSALSRSLGNR
jgi:hypothetical protein